MAIDIVDFSIKNGDVPSFFVCLPEGKPSFSYGFPMVFLWFSHFPMVFPQSPRSPFSYGFPMVFLWFSHFPMVFPSPHLDDGFSWTLAILTRGPEDLLWSSHHGQTTTGWTGPIWIYHASFDHGISCIIYIYICNVMYVCIYHIYILCISYIYSIYIYIMWQVLKITIWKNTKNDLIKPTEVPALELKKLPKSSSKLAGPRLWRFCVWRWALATTGISLLFTMLDRIYTDICMCI